MQQKQLFYTWTTLNLFQIDPDNQCLLQSILFHSLHI